MESVEEFRRRWEEAIVRPILDARADGTLPWVDWDRERGMTEAEIDDHVRRFVDHRRERAEEAYAHHVERDRLAREHGCVFPADGDLDLWHAARDAPTPSLLLGTKEPHRMERVAGLEPSMWSAQTGGICCNHPVLWGVVLPVRPERKEALYELERSHVLENVTSPAPLARLVEYHGLLARYGLTADGPYADMEEAWFPIDLACADDLVDTGALDLGGESVLSALRGERPRALWELIALAVWPRYRELRAAAGGEPPGGGLVGRLRPLWDVSDWERGVRLVIVTENSD